MNKKPLVSILMNCYNGEEFLRESLSSVLSQNYKHWELIFWDNKSIDRSIDLVSSYKDERIRIFSSKEHTNLGKARKNAFEQAKGDYLAFLDVDDIWEKEKLKTQINAFKTEEIGISFTNAFYFSKKRKEVLYKSKNNMSITTKSLITNYPLCLNSIMIDIKKLKKLDYSFDENFSHISDFDLIVRLSSISKITYINQVLSGWRIHNNNESFKRKNLFYYEKAKWCDIHLRKKFLENYIKEISELKLTTLAQIRIINYKLDFNSFSNLKINTFSNYKNMIFTFFSFLPILPKILIHIKNFLFKLKWF